MMLTSYELTLENQGPSLIIMCLTSILLAKQQPTTAKLHLMLSLESPHFHVSQSVVKNSLFPKYLS